MSKNLRTESVDEFFDAVLCLQNREECYRFFEDVCTVNELQAIAQRFEVAHLLRKNWSYVDTDAAIGRKAISPSGRGLEGDDVIFSYFLSRPFLRSRTVGGIATTPVFAAISRKSIISTAPTK